MERAEVARRLRAARALAVLSEEELEQRRGEGGREDGTLTVVELARRGPLMENRISANLIGETERQDRDARPMELAAVAEACGLPREFFSAHFARLADPSLNRDGAQEPERESALAEVREELRRLSDHVERLGGV